MTTSLIESTVPHPELTKIIGRPTVHSLLQMRREETANLYSIPSSQGGGAHGHVGIFMPDDDYLLIAGKNFEPPPAPPAAPPHAPGATAAQITETNRQHEATKITYIVSHRTKE